jgi:acyl-CoA synthetase (AMP-forming)/AMP-acid ligase II
MATKKTTATTKKAATKTAKKIAKKATKKVAAKKVTKKVAKKAPKKSSPAEQEPNLKAKITPTTEMLQQAAYLNYIERIQSGTTGSPQLDWAKAEQDLA